jgi:hypothetical protein
MLTAALTEDPESDYYDEEIDAFYEKEIDALKSSSTSMLQETRSNHGGAQQTKDILWDELCAMSGEELHEYVRRQDWKPRTWSAPHFNCRIAC